MLGGARARAKGKGKGVSEGEGDVRERGSPQDLVGFDFEILRND